MGPNVQLLKLASFYLSKLGQNIALGVNVKLGSQALNAIIFVLLGRKWVSMAAKKLAVSLNLKVEIEE